MFRSDDPFITNYQSIGELFPVETGGVYRTFNMRASFVMLIMGIATTSVALIAFMLELYGLGQRRKTVKIVNAVLMLVLLL